MTVDFYDYVPPTEWKTLNALEGFGENRIAPTGALDGREFDLALDGGGRLRLALAPGGRLDVDEGEGAEPGSFAAREVAPALYLIDAQTEARPERALVAALDLDRAIATVVLSTVVGDGEHGRRVEERVLHGVLPGAAPGDRHERTREMVGRRVQYIYSARDAYEHIYLNDSTYCWQCLAGDERGQADCEPTQAYKLRDATYLFMWIERVVPCDGVVVIDWQRMRNNGRIFGWDTTEQGYNLIPMGARAVELNRTTYASLDG